MRINNLLKQNNNSFTLIELLVVLALVAILSVVVVLTLNPAELIKQARDSNRLSDLSTINTALNLFSADVTSGFMGTSTVVYVSIPDNASSTCGSLGLPTLPSGYTYKCATTATLRNTDGTGWIPVNFQHISSNSPISQLPIDPINTTSTGSYYTYVTGGSWQLATKLESAKYQATAYTSGGADPSMYAIGNNLSLAPFVGGLVGWWKFDGDAIDFSGFESTSSITGSVAYQAGKNNQASVFNGSSFITLSKYSMFNVNVLDAVTWCGWVYWNAATQEGLFSVASSNFDSGTHWDLIKYVSGESIRLHNGSGGGTINSGISVSGWNNVCAVYRKNSQWSLYVNGVIVGNSTTNLSGTATGARIGYANGSYFSGKLDDLRIYSRALSAAEVLALYNANK